MRSFYLLDIELSKKDIHDSTCQYLQGLHKPERNLIVGAKLLFRTNLNYSGRLDPTAYQKQISCAFRANLLKYICTLPTTDLSKFGKPREHNIALRDVGPSSHVIMC